MKETSSPPDFFSQSFSEMDSFESMKEQSHRRAYSMALQLTRNSADAEDLLQETYVKAWRGFDGYMPDRPFLNWLLRIMQRAYLDSRRRDNPVRRAESIHSMVSPNDGDIQDIQIVDEALNAEEELMMEEFSSELNAAMDELPEVYRVAIHCCDIKEMTYEEIAELQNTTIGTVRSRIHRGRRLMRDIVLEKGIRLPKNRR